MISRIDRHSPPPPQPNLPYHLHPPSPEQTCTRLLDKGEGGCWKLLNHVRVRLDEDVGAVIRELKDEPALPAALARVCTCGDVRMGGWIEDSQAGKEAGLTHRSNTHTHAMQSQSTTAPPRRLRVHGERPRPHHHDRGRRHRRQGLPRPHLRADPRHRPAPRQCALRPPPRGLLRLPGYVRLGLIVCHPLLVIPMRPHSPLPNPLPTDTTADALLGLALSPASNIRLRRLALACATVFVADASAAKRAAAGAYGLLASGGEDDNEEGEEERERGRALQGSLGALAAAIFEPHFVRG